MSTLSNKPEMTPNLSELGGKWQANQADLRASPASLAVSREAEEPQLYERQRPNTINRLEAVDPYICVVIICGCSFVVLCQAAVECGGSYSDDCSDLFGYTVAVGVISFIISLLALLWSYCGRRSFEQFSPVVAIFFMTWWGLGTAVSTFSDPFSDAGNGYFAAWGAFIASFIMAGAASERLRSFLGSTLARVVSGSIEAKLSMGIAAASIVLLAAVAVEATDYENPTGQELWGVICSFISCIFILFHTLMRIPCERFTLPPTLFGVVLTVWWLPGVAILTFDAPFKYASNGFFAAWVAFIFSMWLSLEGLDGYGGMGYGNRKNLPGQPAERQPNYR